VTDAIVVQNLSKRYRIGELHRTTFREALVHLAARPWRGLPPRKSILALNNVSFTAGQGEILGIIGRNGAGKSTLLKVLAKITYPTSGTVTVKGRVASMLEVGTGFHSELTGRENIYLNGSIMGMKRREINAKLDNIIRFAGVEEFVDTPLKRYSSGMSLRLGFAVAAHLDSDILLVDEVLAVGDVEFQKKCLRVMDDLRGGGRTVLFVSHNMAAIENHCPRTIWIDNGEVLRDGPTQDVLKDYMAMFAGVQQASLDLSGIENRRGSGEIRYTGIEFLDRDRRVAKVVRSGDALVLRLHYHAETRIPNPHFGVNVFSDLGSRITSMSTWASGFDVPEAGPGDGAIELAIDSLNLMPGRYHLSLWLAGVGPDYDNLEHCATLDIEPADVYGSGRGIERRYGVMFLPCSWRVLG